MTLKLLKLQKVFKARKGAHDGYYLPDRRSVPADSGNSVSDAICGKHTVSRLPDPFCFQRCLDQDSYRHSFDFLHPDRDRSSGRNDDALFPALHVLDLHNHVFLAVGIHDQCSAAWHHGYKLVCISGRDRRWHHPVIPHGGALEVLLITQKKFFSSMFIQEMASILATSSGQRRIKRRSLE